MSYQEVQELPARVYPVAVDLAIQLMRARSGGGDLDA
jgi:hypothetical protein